MVDKAEFARIVRENPDIGNVQLGNMFDISRERARQLRNKLKAGGESLFIETRPGRPSPQVVVSAPPALQQPDSGSGGNDEAKSLTMDNLEVWLRDKLEEARKLAALKERVGRLEADLAAAKQELAVTETRLEKFVALNNAAAGAGGEAPGNR
jgi:hypothetical protein